MELLKNRIGFGDSLLWFRLDDPFQGVMTTLLETCGLFT
jgi:hypothetical protein